MPENPKREGSIHIDLQGYKAQWFKWCDERQVTPSEAFRQFVARLVSQGHDDGPRPVERDAPEKPTVRKEMALTPSEFQRALDLAHDEGYAITKWIVALVRARLTGSAQFGWHELEKLGESNQGSYESGIWTRTSVIKDSGSGRKRLPAGVARTDSAAQTDRHRRAFRRKNQ